MHVKAATEKVAPKNLTAYLFAIYSPPTVNSLQQYARQRQDDSLWKNRLGLMRKLDF